MIQKENKKFRKISKITDYAALNYFYEISTDPYLESQA